MWAWQNDRMARHSTSFQLSEEVTAVLELLAGLRGLTKTEIVVTGILAQAEVFGLIPSLAEMLARHFAAPGGDAELRRRQRLSQQRSRARRRGERVPKLPPGPRRRTPAP